MEISKTLVPEWTHKQNTFTYHHHSTAASNAHVYVPSLISKSTCLPTALHMQLAILLLMLEGDGPNHHGSHGTACGYSNVFVNV
jgi:hypothetical protein